MKKRILKITALAVILVMALALCTSCEILDAFLGAPSDVQCRHTKVSEGSCIEMPTCLSCGVTVGTKYGEHSYEQRSVDATCTEDGYTFGVCTLCNHKVDGDVLPATGHSFGEWIFTSQPTEDKAGEMKRVCSACGFEEVEEVAPHTHSFVSVSAKAPTCTESGYDAYEYCTECNYTGKVVKNALGHAWGNYTSAGNGTHTATCANDPAHQLVESCSGGNYSGNSLPICQFCNTEYDFAARPGNSTYGYHALGIYASGKNMQKLYKAFASVSEDFYNSKEDLKPDDKYYVIGEFDVNDYSLTLDEAKGVWKAFYVSSPAYYWLDAMIVTRGDSILLTVAPNYASASYRRECDAAIEKMTNDCALLTKDLETELDKAIAIVSFIVKGMEYAYEKDGVTPVDDMWAHNITGLAMHESGVCEAYAKSFAYFCALNGIECAMGSGFGGGEAHAWNYVKIDGEWYGADITWTDNSGDEVVFDKFGLSGASIFADHTSHQSTTPNGEFIYKAPTLANKDMKLTALYKNGEKVGMYKSVDDAFAAMTDTEAEYEINIAYYSSYVGALTHTLNSASTPNVKKLVISGKSEYVGDGYLDNNTVLYLRESLTLGSEVELRNLHIDIYDGVGNPVINLNGNTLTLSGESVYVYTKIAGLETDSMLAASTERGAYVIGGIDIYRLEVKSDDIVLGADSHIVYGSYDNIRIYSGVEVDIENEI